MTLQNGADVTEKELRLIMADFVVDSNDDFVTSQEWKPKTK